jgi:hypothetical protein
VRLLRDPRGALIRARFALLTVAAVAGCGVIYPARPGDWVYFHTAELVLSGAPGPYRIPGGPLHLYAEMPHLQMGPLAVAATWLAERLPPHPAQLVAALVMSAFAVVIVAALERAARYSGVPVNPWLTIIGGLIFVGAWISVAGWWMHVDDVLALTAFGLAMPSLARGRWLLPGLLIGVAAATKPWAIVLLPVLLTLPGRRRRFAVLAAVAAAVACWAPFLLAAPDSGRALAGVRISVSADSTLRLMHLAGHWSPGWLRPTQFLLGIVVASLAARRTGWAGAALCGLAVRVGLDAQTYSYYGAGLVLAALAVDLRRRSDARLPVWTMAAATVEYVVPAVVDGAPAAVARLAFCFAALTLLTRQPRHETVGTPPADCGSPGGHGNRASAHVPSPRADAESGIVGMAPAD